MSSLAPHRPPPPLMVWWIIWASITLGLFAVFFIVPPSTRAASPALRYAPLVPLLLSSGLRWVALPRLTDGARAFVLFIIGLSLAEGAAILGLLLVPDHRATYATLGLVGVALYAPTFARRFRTP